MIVVERQIYGQYHRTMIGIAVTQKGGKMKETIYKEDAIDAIVKCTNCNTPKDLREYVAEHSLWSLWSGGVLEALEAVECLPPTPLYTPDEIQTMQDLEWAQLEKMYELGKVGSNWISCKERLPESYADVLVWFEYYRYGSYNRLYQTYGIGTYSENYDSWTINHESGWHKLRVIAWQPLPEPYQPKEDES